MARDRRHRRRRDRGIRKRWIGLFLVVTGLVIGEAALRSLSVGPRAPADFDLRLLTPQADFDQPGRPARDSDAPAARLRTDERGYVEPAGVRGGAPISIAFLGGSTTECRGLRADQRFPALVAALLGARGVPAETLNAGRAGSTVRDLLAVVSDRLAQDGTDHAILMEAANDAAVLARDGAYAERSSAAPGAGDGVRWIVDLAAQRLALASFLRARLLPSPVDRPWPAPAALTRPAPRGPYRARVEAFAALARALHIEPWLATHPLGYVDKTTPPWVSASEQAAFNEEVRAAAAALGVPLVDLAARVAANPDAGKPGALFSDGLHVTEQGARFYAEGFAEALTVRLTQPVEAAPPDEAMPEEEPGAEPAAEEDVPADPEAEPSP
jgi:lysophospholipase L1-like esterase